MTTTWAEWLARCERDETFEPLTVRVRLASPLAGPNPWVGFDALITWAALIVTGHPNASRPFAVAATDDDVEQIPLPLARDPSGVWRCSHLWLDDPTPAGRVHTVQRPAFEYAHLAAAARIKTSGGPTRPRRKELLIWRGTSMTAYLVGDRELVTELASMVTSVGARRGAGYGRVHDVSVEPGMPAEDAWRVRPDGTAARPLPHPDGERLGVVPPYHYRRWHQPAIAPGHAVPA